MAAMDDPENAPAEEPDDSRSRTSNQEENPAIQN